MIHNSFAKIYVQSPRYNSHKRILNLLFDIEYAVRIANLAFVPEQDYRQSSDHNVDSHDKIK